MITVEATQKWLPWTGDCPINHPYKMTANKIGLFLAGFQFSFPL